MKLSILIPTHNEEGSIEDTVCAIECVLSRENINYEIIVINDHSNDKTEFILKDLEKSKKNFKYYNNTGKNGFGNAINFGFKHYSGDCIAIMMADLSDDPEDLIKFYKRLLFGDVDCVFGSRFIKGGKTIDYPFLKLIINRVANFIIRIFIGIKYNDSTNAFKLYKRSVIDGISPLLSPHFNMTIELSLKSIIRGYSYAVLPNYWYNRKTGISKLKIKEMGSRYFFILIYCFVEKYFSRGDYLKNNHNG
jgi:dolichol-phosphate mannosyltransferase